MAKIQNNMRIFLGLLILILMIACSKRPHYLQGTWVGSYNGNDIRLVFNNDSLTVSYLETGNVLSKTFMIDGDKMLIYPGIIDS